MGSRGEDIPLVIGQGGLLNGQKWAVTRKLVIGRDPGCDIVIPDRQISRFHANIVPAVQGAVLSDLGSKNGTFINGQRVETPKILQDGDVIQLALFQHIVYLSSEATIPLDGTILPGEKRTGNLTLDIKSRRVWVGKQEILPSLSAAQFTMLKLLYEREGEVVSREVLINAVWGEEEAIGVSDQAFDALVRRLRQRITALDPGHAYITMMRGYGVKFENRFV